MHLHILGICGTFMGGLAILASELKHKVTGCDQNIYPPMSTQLQNAGIVLTEGFEAEQLQSHPDCVVVGNVMRRGMPVIEALLETKKPLISGPEWLAKHVLNTRHVLAVTGTHGKTTTSAMLAWILDYTGLNPGFLIGGVPNNFGLSARLGSGDFFVVEADEYDSAFFDKRSKFIHYRPNTLIINNIEFDHADIFSDLQAIQTQFHHLLRTIPGSGQIIVPSHDSNIEAVLAKGVFTALVHIHSDIQEKGFSAKPKTKACDAFDVYWNGAQQGSLTWTLLGEHNLKNALSAIAAANHVGVPPKLAIEALCAFKGVKRRLELKGIQNNIRVYDDFAHHPTAIQTTLEGLRAKVGQKRIIAVVDIRSNTMRLGVHQKTLPEALLAANHVYFYQSADTLWDVQSMWQTMNKLGGVFQNTHILLDALLKDVQQGDEVIFMSNGGFAAIQSTFLEKLA